MKIHAVIASIVAVVIGAMVFVFIQIGGDKKGISVGTNEAVACAEASPECIPAVPFVDRKGHMWDHEELVGKVVVLNVWATWCKPCRKEMPELVELREKYSKEDVVLLGLLNENISDAKVDAFIKNYDVNYPIIPMNSELEVALDYPNRLPTTFIYDRNGFLVHKKIGAVTLHSLGEQIDQAL